MKRRAQVTAMNRVNIWLKFSLEKFSFDCEKTNFGANDTQNTQKQCNNNERLLVGWMEGMVWSKRRYLCVIWWKNRLSAKGMLSISADKIACHVRPTLLAQNFFILIFFFFLTTYTKTHTEAKARRNCLITNFYRQSGISFLEEPMLQLCVCTLNEKFLLGENNQLFLQLFILFTFVHLFEEYEMEKLFFLSTPTYTQHQITKMLSIVSCSGLPTENLASNPKWIEFHVYNYSTFYLYYFFVCLFDVPM